VVSTDGHARAPTGGAPRTRRLSDLVGADIGLHVGHNVAGSYGERTYPSRIIQALVDAKRLGEKTGAGFYKFDARRKAAPDPELAPFVERSRKARARAPPAPPAELGLCGRQAGRVTCWRFSPTLPYPTLSSTASRGAAGARRRRA